MNENGTAEIKTKTKRGFLRRLMIHLLAGMIGLILSFPIAMLASLVFHASGVWWGYNVSACIGIVGLCSAVTAISPNIGSEVINLISSLSQGYLDFVCDFLKGLCRILD